MALKYLYEKKWQEQQERLQQEQVLACIDGHFPCAYECYNLGKNCCGIKLGCHLALKEALSTLARLNDISLSEYLRRILIIHYLGNGFIVNFEQQFKLTKRAEQKFNQISEDEF